MKVRRSVLLASAAVVFSCLAGSAGVCPAKIVRFPIERRMPKTVRIPAAEYVKRFGTFPAVGKEVDLAPYARSRVTAVTEREAELAYLGKDGDRFVRVKVNSDLDRKIYGKYGQNGFPLIVLLSPDGDIVGRIDGFRDGPTLYGELSSLLKGKKEGAA